MNKVTIIGLDASNYVRTARLACAEKGIEHEHSLGGLTGVEGLKSEAHLKLHPFGRIPVLMHSDISLYETSAICRYVDTAFDGPALMPGGVLPQARAEQWISAINDYLDGDIIRRYVIEYAFPKGEDGQPRIEIINEALVTVRRDLAVMNEALAHGPFFFGESPMLPDFFLLPMVDYIAVMPEGGDLLDAAPNVARFRDAFADRDSYGETLPERLKDAAA